MAAAVSDALGIDPSAIQRLEITPTEARLTGRGSHLQLLVRGVTAQGESRDVTRHVTWEVDPNLVTVDDRGLLSGVADGTAAIRARFGDGTADAQITVVGSGERSGSRTLSATWHRSLADWGVMPVPATVPRTARTDSSCRCAATIRSLICVPWPAITHRGDCRLRLLMTA